MNNNDFDYISQKLSLFDLSYDSTFDDVKNTIADIGAQVKVLNEELEFTFDEILTKLCEYYDISAKLTSKNYRSSLKRYFNKLINEASSRYQYIGNEHIFHCTSQEHVNRSKALQGRFTSDFLYDYSAKKTNHADTARHLSESLGIASLALKDGLKGYFLTVTLKGEKHYCSGKNWDRTMPPEGAKILSKLITQLRKKAKKAGLKLEYFRTINIHIKDGTPHLHACLFTDDKKKLDELLMKLSSNRPTKIHIKKIKNVNEATLYTMHELWDLTTRDGEKRTLARKSLKVRAFSKSSNVRRMAPTTLVEACRKGTFTSKRDLAALTSYRAYASKDLYGYSMPLLVRSALSYDYANFTRIYSLLTCSRKHPPSYTSLGIDTSASADTSTLIWLGHSGGLLQTSSQGSQSKIKKFWDKMDAIAFENDKFFTSIYEMLSGLQLKQPPDSFKLTPNARSLLSRAGYMAIDNKASEIIKAARLKTNSFCQAKHDASIERLKKANLLSEINPKSLFDLVMKGLNDDNAIKWLESRSRSETHLIIALDDDQDYYSEFYVAA